MIDVPAEPRKMPRWIYLGIMFLMVTISTVVISANGNKNTYCRKYVKIEMMFHA